MSKVKVYAVSLGCPKNRVDTEVMLAGLPGPAAPVDSPERADLVLINTCAFIQPAVEESVGAIVEMVQTLSELPRRPLLAVVGCLPARYGRDLMEELPEVDLWARPSELSHWPELAAAALGRRVAAVEVPERRSSTPPGYAYLKIAEGCNHACNYCMIPAIRGRLRSREADSLVEEARGLVSRGARELVLAAQDLTAYGRDLKIANALPALLERLVELPGLSWLRLMYLYPSGLTPGLLAALRGLGPKLLPYFDIPFQHVDPAVLTAMGRPKSDAPAKVLDRVRAAFPEAAVRTTFIVGHPGETPKRFQALLDFVERSRLLHVGVFPYSPEPGTRSAALSGRPSAREALRRRDELMALQREISAELLAAFVGRTLPVLVDAPHPEWPGLHLGRAWFQAPEVDGATYVSGPGVVPGAMVAAEITESKDYDLVALA